MEPEYSNGVIGVIIGVRLFVYGVALAVLGIAARTMVHEEEQSGGPTPLGSWSKTSCARPIKLSKL
jgi:hypothetical protein